MKKARYIGIAVLVALGATAAIYTSCRRPMFHTFEWSDRGPRWVLTFFADGCGTWVLVDESRNVVVLVAVRDPNVHASQSEFEGGHATLFKGTRYHTVVGPIRNSLLIVLPNGVKGTVKIDRDWAAQLYQSEMVWADRGTDLLKGLPSVYRGPETDKMQALVDQYLDWKSRSAASMPATQSTAPTTEPGPDDETSPDG